MAYRDSLVPFPVPSIWNYSREEIPGVSLEKRGIFWYVVRRSPTKELELETIICCRQGTVGFNALQSLTQLQTHFAITYSAYPLLIFPLHLGCDAMPLTYTGMCKEHSIQESVPVLAPESAEGTPVRGFVSRSTNMSQFDQFLDKTLGSSVQCTAAVTPNPQTPFPRAGCSRAQEIQKVSLLIPRMAMQTKNLQPSADSKSSRYDYAI